MTALYSIFWFLIVPAIVGASLTALKGVVRMTAENRLRQLTRDGMAYGLAVHIVAREYGKTTKEVALSLNAIKKKNKFKSEVPEGAWWLN